MLFIERGHSSNNISIHLLKLNIFNSNRLSIQQLCGKIFKEDNEYGCIMC